MNETFLKSKLKAPRLRLDFIPRSHLTERLTEGLDRKLTVISAPAGSGKTTLLSEWISGVKQPIAWISLEKNDNNPITFWSYFIAAIQTVQPSVGQAALVALQSPRPIDIESILAMLINDIIEKMPSFVVVIDDYHMITSRLIHNALAFLIQHLPAKVSMIILARNSLPISLAHLRGCGQLVELHGSDLCFTNDEATNFLNKVMGLELTPEEIEILQGRTEGWIAGLQMAALSIRGQEDTSKLIETFSGNNFYIMDYLMEEVIKRQKKDVKNFLLQTSILECLNASLCDAVTDRQDGQKMLKYLEDANMFGAVLVPLSSSLC